MELWLTRSVEPLEACPADSNGERILFEAPGKALPSLLLVDDSNGLRQLTADTLRHHGFIVTCAAGGAEALTIIEGAPHQCDVIVTDFAMPLVSGLDVIRFARNLRSNWPAVIITGYADIDAIANRPPDVPLVNKPIRESELIESILRANAGAAAASG